MSRSRRTRQARPRREPSTTVVRATTMGDIVVAIPYQVGFIPDSSLVIVSLRGPRRRTGLVTRVDLPPPEQASRQVEELTRMVVRDGGRACVALVYDDQPWDPVAPPRADLARLVGIEAERRGLELVDVLYVSPERFWSLTCSDSRCCPPQGRTLASVQDSEVAAAYVLAGIAPLRSREALARRLDPAGPLQVLAAQQATDGWLEARARDLDGRLARARTASDEAAAVEDHIQHWGRIALELFQSRVLDYRAGLPELGADDAGLLLACLDNRSVRDLVLMAFCRYGMTLPDEAAELIRVGAGVDLSIGGNFPFADVATDPDNHDPDNDEAAGGVGDEVGDEGGDGPDQATEQAVESLLVDLCRRADETTCSPPLTLLAWHCWARGDGAMARIAGERALAADPTYRLASLLMTALDRLIPPQWVARARAGDELAG